MPAAKRFSKSITRDHLAGGFVVTLGLGVLAKAWSYDKGTMVNVGPGFIPVVLGILLTAIGFAIALAPGAPDSGDEEHLYAGPDLRGVLCIVASVLLFAGLSQYAGLIPATFACVLVAALGDRSTRLWSAVLLAAGMTVFGVLVFSYGLGVQLPLIRRFGP